jgi:mRNA interferase RelE/StbE
VIVEFDKSFSKSLQRIKDSSILLKAEKTIVLLEEAKSLTVVPQCKKMSGYKRYYRIRIGEYRLGLEKTGHNTVRLIIIAHRRDIYQYFP